MKRLSLVIATAVLIAGCGGSSKPPAGSGAIQLALTDQSEAIAAKMRSDTALLTALRNGYHDLTISVYEIDCNEATAANPYRYTCVIYYSTAENRAQDGSRSINYSAQCDRSARCSWRTDALPGES